MHYLYWEIEVDISTLQKKYDILIYFLLITTSILAVLPAVKNIKLTPDSLRYGLVSQQILSGNGIRLPVTRLIADNMVPTGGTIPFIEQPPLLPILLALLGGVTTQSVFSAQILNLICHLVISIFSFLIMKKYCNTVIALLTGILVAFSYPLLALTNYIISEPLFIALTVASVYFLITSLSSNHTKFIRIFFIASICTSAAIFTRWAGIPLIAIFFWIELNLIKNKKPESKYVSTFIAMAIPVITTAALFLRTYIHSGMMRGWQQPSPGRSYMSAFTGTIKMIFLQFQLGPRPIALIAIFSVLFILSILINSNSRKELSKIFSSGIDVIIIFIISYTALITVTLTKKQPFFELRFVGPLVPFLYIVVISFTVLAWNTLKLKGFPKLSLAGIILSLGIITFVSFYKTCLNLPNFSDKHEKYYSVLHSCTYNWIKEHYKENTLITTNQPYPLSFFGGYSTVELPHRRFEKNMFIPEDMESVLPNRMSEFGSRVLVLFAGIEEQYDGSYIARLFNKKEDNDNYILVHKCPDGVVYNTKK